MIDLQKKYKKRHFVSFSSIDDKKISISMDHLSFHGVFYGGIILQTVGEIARNVAMRHAGFLLEDKRIDFVHFCRPVKKGDFLICFASINKAWRSSLEVGVKVMAEDFLLLEKKKILSAYFTFAVNENEKNIASLPLVVPQTREEKKRYLFAEKRKLFRFGPFSRR